MSAESMSMTVETSSMCSTFTSSDEIHCVPLNPRPFGSIAADDRVNRECFVTQRSGDNTGSLGER